MSDPQPDFVEFFKLLDETARVLYAKDEMPPVYALFQSKAGSVASVLFDCSPMQDESILQIMQILASAYEAVHFGCAMDSWMAESKKGDPHLLPSKNPARKEAVPIFAYQRGSPLISMNTYEVKRAEGVRQLELLDNEATRSMEVVWGNKVLLPDGTDALHVAVARSVLMRAGFPVKEALEGVVRPGAEVLDKLRAHLKPPPAFLEFLRALAESLKNKEE